MGHIYWIASYPKSGNTWVRVLLNNLVSERDDERDLDRLVEFAPDENNGRFYGPLLDRPIAELATSELAAVRPRVHRALANMVPGFIFVKTHSMLGRHAGTLTITPEATAGAIYIVRNPLDVVVSYRHFRDSSIEQTIAILNMRGFLLPRTAHHSYVPTGSWSENVLTWTGKPNPAIHVVRYEDLLERPAESLAGMVAFLRMKATSDQIRSAVDRASFERLQRMERETGFPERPATAPAFFRRGEAGQWREELSESQVAAIVHANRAAMQKYGYWLAEFDRM